MSVNAVNAAAAYARAVKSAGGAGMEARDAGASFADMVKQAAGTAIETMKSAETMSAKAVTKEADLIDVVNAVNNAEITLQSVVAVRDRVVQAYQDIIRMPI